MFWENSEKIEFMKVDTQSFRTYSAKAADINPKWWIIDAEDVVLGKLATKAATVLRGKHKPQFTPHADTGDFIVVVNAEKVKLTGNKVLDKQYFRHSHYPGGEKFENVREVLQKKPEQVIERAVWGMLPHNNLGRSIYKKLKVYAGPTHPHSAQNPQELKIS